LIPHLTVVFHNGCFNAFQTEFAAAVATNVD
jgi:hypothetical protein